MAGPFYRFGAVQAKTMEQIVTETAGRLEREEGGLAWRRNAGRGPTVVWLGGFRSDMTGSKASALASWAEEHGRDFLRFDYFGHGASDGAFRDGTIGRWRDDALAVLDQLVAGPCVLVGSSMGGWIACLAALARPLLVRGMVLAAPAADFTDKLMWPQFSDEIRRRIEVDGVWTRPSAYDPAGYPITRALIEDGRRWNVLDDPLAIDCPIRILQGGRDVDVPMEHALWLERVLTGDDVVLTLVKDADHSMSRPGDLRRLIAMVEEVCEGAV